jgi:2-hydroxychromene-2-carboxylate isomerase
MGVPHDPAANIRMSPLPALRAFTWLKERDPALAKRFAQAVYRAHWAEGRDMSTAAAVAEVGAPLGIERGALVAATGDEAIKRRLREQVDASLAKGVFGCPTFIVRGEMFWGADRLDQVERWLSTGGW